MKIIKRSIMLLGLLFAVHVNTQAQQIDDNSITNLVLKDGTTVVLYQGLPAELKSLDANGNPKANPAHDWYYLPTNLRLTSRPDGVPEFLFTKFTTEKSSGPSGAIMHFLMKFGLTQDQQVELQKMLVDRTKDSLAVLKGQIQLQTDDEGGSFQIISATLSDKSMATSIVNGRAPLLEGGKTAVATRLTADGAQLLASTFEKAKSITDLSISLNYKYITTIPAFKAKFVYDWKRVRGVLDSLSNSKSETSVGANFFGLVGGSYSDISENSFRQLIDTLMEKKAVYMEIRESGITDERMNKIREAFMQMFLNSFTTASVKPPMPEVKGPNDKGDKDPGKYGPDVNEVKGDLSMVSVSNSNVDIKSTFKAKIDQATTEIINVDYALPIVREFSLVGNLAEWYNAVRDNKSCVNSVNLNDPFFQYRDIRFIMDLEAKEMFEKEINYVTINARKTRSVGNSFSDRVTMDLKYFNEKGITAAMQYARGEDTNPDNYEYMTQWSLRGGKLWPANPQWEEGKWEGVTLLPPLMPRTIEFEGNIDELKAANITRATLQVRYLKFGEEVEENISVSVVKGEPIVSKQIYMDRETKGYAYRIIYNNKESGKLATDFVSKINDFYVYAVIPEAFKDKTSDGFKKGLEVASKISETPAGGKVTAGQVLNTFREIFGKVNNIK